MRLKHFLSANEKRFRLREHGAARGNKAKVTLLRPKQIFVLA
jgi:hypothetical protein